MANTQQDAWMLTKWNTKVIPCKVRQLSDKNRQGYRDYCVEVPADYNSYYAENTPIMIGKDEFWYTEEEAKKALFVHKLRSKI